MMQYFYCIYFRVRKYKMRGALEKSHTRRSTDLTYTQPGMRKRIGAKHFITNYRQLAGKRFWHSKVWLFCIGTDIFDEEAISSIIKTWPQIYKITSRCSVKHFVLGWTNFWWCRSCNLQMLKFRYNVWDSCWTVGDFTFLVLQWMKHQKLAWDNSKFLTVYLTSSHWY